MTTAAFLEYIVTANTTQANAALAKTQSQMTTMGKTSKATGAMAATGFAAVTAAVVATGAAVFKVGQEFDKAYDKIRSQTGATGKEAEKLEKSFRNVLKTVPTDFDSAATAVAGLNQRLGETGKPLTELARQITALAKITGEDVQENVEAVTRLFGDWGVATKDQTDTLDGLFRVAQKTGATVSDLARNMVQFGAPLRNLGFDIDQAAAMFGAFEKTGVNITTVLSGLRLSVGNFAKPSADLAATMKDLSLNAKDTPAAIIEMFRQIKTLRSESEATALAIDAFGKRAGPDLVDTIRGGKFELDSLIKTFQSGDGTIRQAERRTRDFSEQWMLFKNRVAVVLEPIAVKFFKVVGDGMKAIAKIDFAGAVKALRDFWNEAGVLRDVIKAITGFIIERFRNVVDFIKGVVKLISSILTGDFQGMWDALKQIFKAGVSALLAPLRAMIDIVKTIGGRIGDALSGVFSAVWGTIKNLFAKGADFILGTLTTVIDGIAKVADIGSKLPGPLGDAWDKIQAGAEDTADSINKFREQVRDSADGAGRALAAAARTGKQELGQLATVAQDKGKKTGDGIKDGIRDGVRDGERELGHLSAAAGREFGKVTSESEKMRKGTSGNFSSLNAAINSGLENIGQNTNKALKAFGVKPVNFAIVDGKKTGTSGLQRGGMAKVPGTGTGDKVPAMLEPGEVVLNRKAVAAMGGADRANSINRAIPRFAKGGKASGGTSAMSAMVALTNEYEQHHYPYLWGGGHQGFVNASSPVDCSGFVSDVLHAGGLLDGAPMVSGSLASWGKPGTGPLTVYANSGHTLLSLNGKFAGTSSSNPGGGAGWIEGGLSAGYLSAFAKRTADVAGAVGAMVTGAAEKIKREVIEGPDGPLKDLGQKALDKARSAANKFIAKKMPSGTVGGGDAQIPDVATGPVQEMAHEMVRKIWGESQWSPFVSLEMAEAGWNPRAVNPSSGAAGLAQALPPSKYPPGAWPYEGPESARLQLEWMMDYISERYGNPASAWAFHQSHNWYKKGGIVQKLAKGGGARGDGKNKPGTDPLASPWAQAFVGNLDPFGDGGTSYTPADIPKKIQDLLDAYTGAITLLDKEIMLAEHFAGYNSSEAGTSLGPMETAEQLFLYEQLLTNLLGLASTAKRGMGLKRTSEKGKAGLAALLPPLVGDNESVGRILETKQKIDELRNPGNFETSEEQQFTNEYLMQLLREANQRTAVSQAQYAVFSEFAGGFANGGYIPQGQWGVVGESGPEVVGGPTTVYPAAEAGAPTVTVNVAPGMEWLKQFISVEVTNTTRKQARGRPLGGPRGM